MYLLKDQSSLQTHFGLNNFLCNFRFNLGILFLWGENIGQVFIKRD